MNYTLLQFDCSDADQYKRISDLLTLNRRVEERLNKLVLGSPLHLLDTDIIEDALQSNLGTMHKLERILKERAG